MRIKGFTLIELSIALVIIGLIVGGIFVGKDLINSAKQVKVISEKTQYEIAIQQFKSRYNALPGDYSKAYQLWGASCAGTGSNNHCAGDGNGYIDSNGTNHEIWGKAFCHMQLADILKDSNACPVYGPDVPKGTTNIDASPMSKAFADAHWDINAGWQGSAAIKATDMIYGRYQNMLMLRGLFFNVVPTRLGTAMTPSNVQAIDVKIDDGFASTGQVVGMNGRSGASGNPANCVAPNNYATQVTTANYVLTTNTAACQIGFFLDK